MIALKIIGIVIASLLLLICLLLISKAKLILSHTREKGFSMAVKVWGIKFTIKGKEKSKKKKKKKKNGFSARLKNKLGLDVFDGESREKDVKTAISDRVAQIVAIITLFFNRIKWLLSKIRIDKFNLLALCGGDSAEAALEYGLVCATVYPLSAYIADNLNFKKNAEDIQIKCNFDGDTYLEIRLVISIKIYYIIKTAVNCLTDLAVIAENAEDSDNER